MSCTHTHPSRVTTGALMLGAALLVAPATDASAVTRTTATAAATTASATASAAADGPAKAFEKRPYYTRHLGLSHPTGATFLDGPRLLAVAQSRPRGTVIRLLNPRSEKLVGRARLRVRLTPGTLADNGRGRLAGLAGRTFVSWPATARGTVRPSRRPITGASVAKVRALTYDPRSRTWLGLDTARSRLMSLRV